jgi:hypothetical protein
VKGSCRQRPRAEDEAQAEDHHDGASPAVDPAFYPAIGRLFHLHETRSWSLVEEDSLRDLAVYALDAVDDLHHLEFEMMGDVDYAELGNRPGAS